MSNRNIILRWITSVNTLQKDIEYYKHGLESWESIRNRTSAEQDSDDLKEEVDIAWAKLHDSVQELCPPATYGGKRSKKARSTRKNKHQRRRV